MSDRMTEADIMRGIQRELSVGTNRLMRNNCGALLNRNGQLIRFGLGAGTSDLIGFASITITPEMVGKKVAVFIGAEVKLNSAATEEQVRFLDMVERFGGIGVLARSPQDVRGAIGQWRGT